MPDYRAPGVYVEELSVAGPIAGVGTSTAAFVGPAQRGPIGEPTKITNWTQFTSRFGSYLTSPRRYLAHAVRGFFDNGGTVAYVARVGTARAAGLELADRATPAGTALVVRAREEGPAGHNIAVAVGESSAVAARLLTVSVAGVDGSGATLTFPNAADATRFLPDDVLDVGGQRAQVARVRGTELTLTTPLPADVADTTVRLADPIADQRRLRVAGTGVERGSVLRLTQGNTTEVVTAETVGGDVVTLSSGLTKTYSLKPDAAPATVGSLEFSLSVTGPDTVEQRFEPLSMDPRHSRYFARVVTSTLVEVSLPDEPSTALPPNSLPKPAAATKLTGGVADDLTAITENDYDEALARLAKVDDVNLVCVPDAAANTAVQQKVLAHCESTKDRFAVLDCAPNADPLDGGPTGVLAHRAAVSSTRGYAALYYPWIQVADPAGGTLLVPPSGHVAGIFARSDTERGVHKAPANEPVNGALGLARRLGDVEQGELNVEGVNVLRVFGGGRPLVYGARTTAPTHETTWRYVNVRRLFLFIEESLQEGLRWAVFEPNDLSLRKRLARTVSEFLTRVWGAGALFGATADEAFYVKIDDENNPPDVRELGQIVIEIGVAPVRPAEFIVVRIGMTPGGSQVREG